MIRRIACCLLLLASCLTASAADVMRGVLKGVEGTVEIQMRGDREWRPAPNGMAVGPGDRISIGMRGKAALVFPNSVTEIGPMTQFVVGRAMQDNETFYTELFLQVGKVVSDVNEVGAKKNLFTVTSPSAVCGIRGSRQEVGHFPQTGTEMKMQEGHGYLAIPTTPANAVAAFNEWIQAAGAPPAEGASPAVLDPRTMDYVYEAGVGQSVEVRDASDPSGVADATQNLAAQAVPDVTPAALSREEKEAAQVSTEPVDAPVTLTIREDQTATLDELREATVKQATGGTSTTIRFPNRPGQ